MFSDETEISLVQKSHRMREWRNPTTRAAQLLHARPVPPFSGGNAIFRAGIMDNDRIELIYVELRTTSEDILQPYVRMWRATVGEPFLFMDDNARSHRTKAENGCFETDGISCLDWPTISPGRNSIEHACNMFGRSVAVYRNPPGSVLFLAAQGNGRISLYNIFPIF